MCRVKQDSDLKIQGKATMPDADRDARLMSCLSQTDESK